MALDELEAVDFNVVEEKIYKQLSLQRRDKKALVLDVTDTYFSGSNADWKSRKGKDGKYSKLIQIALAVTKKEGFPIMHKIYEGNINNVYIKSYEFEKGGLIVVYNPAIEIAKRMQAMETKEYEAQEARYMGYSLIYHNHTTELSKVEVVKSYYEKDIVEKAFKEMKSSINLQPIRKYLLSHVKAYVKICYLAYAILSYIQYKLKTKGNSAVSALEKTTICL